MRPGVTFVPFAILSAVLLAGCTNNTPGHGGATGARDPVSVAPTVSSSPQTSASTSPPVSTAVPADVPTTGPNLLRKGERPPVLPAVATEHTPAGAVAFAKFFIQTIDWGFATTSGAYMRHYYAKSCVECVSHADGLDNTRKASEHYVGGRFTITGVMAAQSAQPANASVVVTFDLTSAVVLDASGTYVNGDRAYSGLRRQLWLNWMDGAWQVTNMRPA
jgi:hypothetical protein